MEEEMADEAGQEDGPAPPDEEVAACLTKTQFAACAKQWTRPAPRPLDPATDELTFQQSEVCRRRCPRRPHHHHHRPHHFHRRPRLRRHRHPNHHASHHANHHHRHQHHPNHHGPQHLDPRHCLRRRLQRRPLLRRHRLYTHTSPPRPASTGGLHDRQRDPRADRHLHAGVARRRDPHVRHHCGGQQRDGTRARLLPIPVRARARRLHAGALRGVPADAGAAAQGPVAEGAARQPGAARSPVHPPATLRAQPATLCPACKPARRRCSTCAWSRSSRSCTSSSATWATS